MTFVRALLRDLSLVCRQTEPRPLLTDLQDARLRALADSDIAHDCEDALAQVRAAQHELDKR